MKEIRSKAYLGGANVLLEFEAGFDADKLSTTCVKNQILLRQYHPITPDEPRVEEVNLSLFLICLWWRSTGAHSFKNQPQPAGKDRGRFINSW